ncbi:MAG: YmdB family metallophosphoesterase [Holosporales bacterium]|jgi:metallophosphoesterase (TIGR00282 family)|nr:YmdB family metallophosphoesterase [Holosporales bacterium]
MRILFLGDIVGKSGRTAVKKYVSESKARLKIDCVIANGENSSHGFGIRASICEQLFEAGVDVITLGNHSFDQKGDIQIFDSERRLIRPLNYPRNTPGHGFCIHSVPRLGKKILVINVIGRIFMELNDDPFQCLEDLLKIYRIGYNVDAIAVDIHAEATSEKIAFARYFDGRVSFFAGTHTHVPTADAQIFRGGTGFLADAGMCGDYDSIIGMEYGTSVCRFVDKLNMYSRMVPASGNAAVCGAMFEIDDKTGLCIGICPIRSGGLLIEQKEYDAKLNIVE